MKTTGTEWKQFIADDPYWNGVERELYIDHWCLKINEIEYTEENDINFDDIPDNATIQIKSGVVVSGALEAHVFTSETATYALKSFFKKWKEKQTTKKFIVEIAIQDTNKFIELMRNSKLGKIIR